RVNALMAGNHERLGPPFPGGGGKKKTPPEPPGSSKKRGGNPLKKRSFPAPGRASAPFHPRSLRQAGAAASSSPDIPGKRMMPASRSPAISTPSSSRPSATSKGRSPKRGRN